MTQNKKKGIAKKALSISLVAAMLATSNVPAWASGFEAVDDNAGFTLESEAPAMEDVDTYDTDMLAASPVDDTTTLVSKLAAFAWDQAPEKMAEALKAAKEVKVAGQSYAVSSAKVGYAMNSASVTDGALDAGDTFVEWTSGTKYTADTVGKLLVAELKADADSDPYYVAGGQIAAVALADAKDWSVTVNGKSFKKDAVDLTIPVADEYKVEKISVTMRDGSVTTLDSVQTELSSNLLATVSNAGEVSIQFLNGYKGFTDVALTFDLEIQNKSMSEVVSITSGTLTYDVAGLVEQAKRLVTAKDGKLEEGTDYDVSLASDAKGERPITGTVNAGDKVYIVVSGTAGSDYAGYKKYVSSEYTVAAKNLSTLYLDPDALDVSKIEYVSGLDLSGASYFGKAGIFKYDKDSESNIAGAITAYDSNALEIVFSPSATPKAGEKVTVTINKKSNVNTNYTGTFKVEFTPIVTQDSLSDIIGTGFDDAVTGLNTKGLVYDGIGWNVDKLFKDPISEFTRAEYKISCVEVPSGNIVDAGDYTLEMTIIGGAYAGQSVKATTQLTVTPASLQSFQYGKGITYNEIVWENGLKNNDTDKLKEKLGAVLTFGNTKLVEDKDFEVVSVTTGNGNGDVVAAGDAVKLNIQGIAGGNFAGAAQVACAVGTVKARALPEMPSIPTQEYKAGFTVNDIKVVNEAGDDVEYLTTIKDGDYTLVKDTDYEVKLSKVPTSGEGQVTLTLIGKGNYAGSVQTKTFEITKETINGSFKYYVTASQVTNKLPEISYNYNAATGKNGIVYDDTIFSDVAGTKVIVIVDEDGKIVDPDNYSISYKNNTAVGTATIEANGKDGYDLHAVANFEITPLQVTSGNVADVLNNVIITVDKTAGYDYTGEAIIPKVTLTKAGVALKDGKYTLVEGTDYKVELKNNVNVPEASATADKKPQIVITGLGNYVFNEKAVANIKDNTGIKDNFTIKPVSITKASVTAKSVEYAGGLEVTPDITVISPVTKKNLAVDVDYTLKLEDAVNAGTATATIKAVKDNNNYNFGAGIEVKFEITKKSLSKCDASVANGKVVIKNNGILVPASEYTVTEKDGVYTVKATEKNYTGTITVKETVLEATTLKVTNRTTSTVSLAWDKVEGAEGYTIWFRSEYDTEVSRKVINGGDVTKWTQTGLQAGTKYFYTVRPWVKNAEGKNIFGGQSKTQRGTTKPMAAKITAASAANGKIKVTLAGKAAGAEMYSMCYADSRSAFAANNFKVGIRTSYTTRTLSKTFSKGTYYVCVKSYRDLGNGAKVYGAWSNTFKVVVK